MMKYEDVQDENRLQNRGREMDWIIIWDEWKGIHGSVPEVSEYLKINNNTESIQDQTSSCCIFAVMKVKISMVIMC